MGQADALAAILVGSHLCNDPGGDVAGGGEAVGLLDIGAGDDGAVLEHVVQIDEVTVVHVLGKIVGVVEVDEAFLMRLNDLRVQQQAGSQVFGNLTGHIVALDAVDGGVLVGVLLLDFLVLALDEAQDALVGGVGLALEALDIAVGDIVAGNVMGLDVHELVFHHILYLFHADSAVECLTLVGHGCGDVSDLLRERRALPPTESLALVTAVMILVMSKGTSAPLRLMIFIALLLFRVYSVNGCLLIQEAPAASLVVDTIISLFSDMSMEEPLHFVFCSFHQK